MLVQIVKNKSFYCSKNFSSLHIWTAIIYNRDYKQWIKHILMRLQSDGHFLRKTHKHRKEDRSYIISQLSDADKNVKTVIRSEMFARFKKHFSFLNI